MENTKPSISGAHSPSRIDESRLEHALMSLRKEGIMSDNDSSTESIRFVARTQESESSYMLSVTTCLDLLLEVLEDDPYGLMTEAMRRALSSLTPDDSQAVSLWLRRSIAEWTCPMTFAES